MPSALLLALHLGSNAEIFGGHFARRGAVGERVSLTNQTASGNPGAVHFAVSTWIETGIAPKKIMTFAGHSSIPLTFDRHGHLFPSQGDDRAAFDKIESRILGL